MEPDQKKNTLLGDQSTSFKTLKDQKGGKTGVAQCLGALKSLQNQLREDISPGGIGIYKAEKGKSI